MTTLTMALNNSNSIGNRKSTNVTLRDSIIKFTNKKTDKTKHRPLLHNYMGKTITVTGVYSYKTRDQEGLEIALITNIRDEYHQLLCDHLWIKITPNWYSTLNMIKKDSLIRLTGKVCTYDRGTKTNLHVTKINLIHRERRSRCSGSLI